MPPLPFLLAQPLLFAGILGWALYSGAWRRPSLLHFYAISCFITGIANLDGYLPQYDPGSYVFYYASLPQVPVAARIGLFGSIAITVGMWLGSRMKFKKLKFPAVGEVLPPGAEWGLALLALLLFFANLWVKRLSMGLAGTFLFVHLPYGMLFLLARRALAGPTNRAWWLAFGLVAAFTLKNLLFAYLRMEMILPSVAFFFGLATSGHFHWRELLRWRYLAFYLWFGLFVLAFPWMINNRGQYGTGLKRLDHIRSAEPAKILSDKHAGETVLTRFSLLNQQSQVARIVEEEGFYRGKTLEYWTYVFIPRFLWKEKPPVNQGAWFAYKINEKEMGHPYQGNHTWSVNMTIPGELYLNFSWAGVVLGGLLIGWLVFAFWQALQFYEPSGLGNLWVNVYAFYLLRGAAFQLGADLQFLVNVIAYFVLVLVLTLAWKALLKTWTSFKI